MEVFGEYTALFERHWPSGMRSIAFSLGKALSIRLRSWLYAGEFGVASLPV